MEKIKILLVLFISFISILSIYFIETRISGMFLGFGEPQNAEWWNVSWHYRIRLEINSTQYSRTDWPVELKLNFTDLLPEGTFDINSTRVFEYSGPNLLYEVQSQFEIDENFNETNNAIGTLVFLLNGTTNANSNRTFYVYYDTIENGAKESPNYPTYVNYSSNEVIQVNNSFLKFYIDTNRGENTSGLYHVEDIYENIVFSEINNDRTTEYLEYSNGTYNFSFNFTNTTFKNGPIRLVIEQVGDEILFGNPEQKTNEGIIKKRYYIYDKVGSQQYGTFIKIWQKYINNASYSITRNSTPAGALAFDVNRTFNSGKIFSEDYNSTNPNSWARASGGVYTANELVGLINLNQTGTSNYFAISSSGRVGIQLNSVTINSGSYIEETALVYFAGTGGAAAVTEFESIRDRFVNPIEITQYLPEIWYVVNEPKTNATVYNRNETVLIIGNLTEGDPYNLTKYMNATLDMGTASESDDVTIALYDDGNHNDGNANDKIFANVFEIPNNANATVWTINFTMYTQDLEFLNFTIYNFNVTDILNVVVNVTNKKPLTGSTVVANIYVKNYRQDTWIPNAIINCSYDSSEVINKTDYNNGTYSVNFTAPSQEGPYTLYCNATKNNNFGNNSDDFYAETSKTNVIIIVEPQNPFVYNITLYDNDSFTITANATNIASGTAYSSNISLELLNGWNANSSLEQCGDIEKNSFCIKSFNVTVPNGTAPGNYYFNVTVNWRNPDGTISMNKTEVNVTVVSNPKVDIEEAIVSSEVGDGIWNAVGNFTVLSIGNDELKNVTFNCFEGVVCNDFTVSFEPENISSLNVNEEQSVLINVSIPMGYSPGTYDGTVNVSAENDNYDTFVIEVTIPPKTNVSIKTSISNYTASNISQTDNETFEFETNVTNIGNSSARFVNISLALPNGWSSNSSFENCNNLTKNSFCTKSFNISIPNGTLAGNYLINISTNWTNLDNSLGNNSTTINVTVTSHPLLNISKTSISGTVEAGSTNFIDNFTVLSIGNDELKNVTFNCFEGVVCNDFTVSFEPENISSLNVNEEQTVNVSVSVPLGYLTGDYNGTVNVSAENDNYKNLTIFVNVPSNRTWTMTPTSCHKSEYPDEGTVCEVTVINLGNDRIDFTIAPEEGNHTKVNVTSFYVNASKNYTFNVTYNVTNIPQATYNSIFTVSAVQTANPSSMILNITLYPYLPPFISFDIVPNSTEQNSSVEIFANITDRSNSGIKWVNISVTMPNGTENQTNMTFNSESGNLSQWYFKYPNNLGETMQRGFYNVTVKAEDNIGNIGDLAKNFSIYVKMLITSTTLSSTYLQGDTGSIYYIVKNMSGIGLENANVTFKIIDPTGNISYYAEQKTNAEGTISPLPSFTLPSDVLTGNYTLVSNTSYYDSIAGKNIFSEINSTFQVQSRTITVSGLFADIETAVVWYPDNIMRFGFLIYNGEGRPVDPDSMNLTVYDPANNVYFSTNISQMTKRATGYYTYQYAMPSNTPSGMFLAVLNVSQENFQTMKLKAFRVAHGGPYDVRINLFENEVPQGDYLDFSIVIENKGEVTQDVYVEYWVSSQNTTYYYSSEAVLTPSLTNQSFTRSAYIYSTQPLGTYTLNVKVTYDNVQPPILANTTFLVIRKEIPQPPSSNLTPQTIYVYPTPTGGTVTITPPTEKISAGILITTYNSNVSLARNFTKIESVTVKNIGIVDLYNISLFILGIPLDWFKVTPENYAILSPENSTIFLIEFKIPSNAKVDEYKASLVVTSGVVSDQKSITIKIYQSLEELLKADLKKLREELQDLYIDIKIAEKEGKDVSTVLDLYNEAKTKLEDAEKDLEEKRIEDALDKASNVSKLIRRAKDLLESLEKVKEEVGIPIWIIFVIFICIIAGMLFVVFVWKRKKVTKIRPYIISLGRLAEAVKKKKMSKEEIEAEKEKLTRMLKILEKEKEEGIVSISSYEKMKKSIEERLNKLEK
ncbi:MAG: NEW3 domain-containing protein [Candidatus Aenigmatarchaeota archaeon]